MAFRRIVRCTPSHAVLLLATAGVLSCAMGAGLQGSTESDNSPPNIVIIVADDLGWADVGYHGSEIKTPHLDRFVKQGVELDRFYVCPVCSPTRAGLMTGRYPIRFGLMRSAIPPWSDYGLPTDELLMPQVLAQAGYKHRGQSTHPWQPIWRMIVCRPDRRR